MRTLPRQSALPMTTKTVRRACGIPVLPQVGQSACRPLPIRTGVSYGRSCEPASYGLPQELPQAPNSLCGNGALACDALLAFQLEQMRLDSERGDGMELWVHVSINMRDQHGNSRRTSGKAVEHLTLPLLAMRQ